MKQIALIALVILSLSLCANPAQGQEIIFKPVEGNNGEPLYQINSITQDPHGYMWFSGQGASCIYRYDGVRMIAFRHDSLNKNSLGGLEPETIYADSTGIIWIGYLRNDGLDSYNPSTGQFNHYEHTNDPGSISEGIVSAILRDHLGRLWVGTENGLDQLDEKKGTFIHYRNIPGDSSSLSCNFIRQIYEDRQGVLWIGTGYEFTNRSTCDGGLNRMEPNGTFTRFTHNPNNPGSLINNKVKSIFEDSRGIFWIGTSGDGLHTMDRKTGNFERHRYDPLHPEQLSRPALKNSGINDPITFIKEDASGSIWIGTYRSGINRYDPTTKKVTHYESSNGYPDKNCWTAFKSSDGVLWLSSTDQAGFLFRVDPKINQLRNFLTPELIGSLYEDKQGTLWASRFSNGFFEYDNNRLWGYELKKDKIDSSYLIEGKISIFQDGPDTLWLGTGKGMLLMNKKERHIARVGYKSAEGSGTIRFIDEPIKNIIKDKNGIMWMATSKGLYQFDAKNLSLKKYLHDELDTTSIRSNKLTSVLEDHAGNIWASFGSVGIAFSPFRFDYNTGNGIDRFNKANGTFIHYLNDINILCLAVDMQGNIWAGSGSNGLYKFNKEADRFEAFFDPVAEMNNEPIINILEDDTHNLWVMRTSSLVRVNADRISYFIYGKNYGIRSNTLRDGVMGKTSKGEILVGNNNGFYILSPQVMSDTVKPLQLNVTGFLVNDHLVYSGKEGVLKQPIEDTKTISLQYNQNNISFNFAAIDYRAPENNKYYTLLENYDSVWREAGDKSAHYINLPRGTYFFRVKAINIDGIKAEKTIKIVIAPPWWKTLWAYIFYGLLLLTAVWFLHKFQQRRTISRERQKAQVKQLAQAKEIEKAYTQLGKAHENLKSTQAQLIQSEKMASLGELTAGIAHEIQNPLNFVNNFSEVNNELVDELKAELAVIATAMATASDAKQEAGSRKQGNIQLVNEIADNIKDNGQKISHHGKRADGIVKGMLQHSKSTGGQKELVDINTLADEYLRLSYHGLRAKDKSFNAKIETDFDQSIGKINVIPQDIGRVILNLINNAFYAVGEKQKENIPGYEPTVTLTTRRVNSNIELRVKDNGPGIPDDIVDKIFQPFFTTKPTGEGTGLGLSLAYDIITKGHGGKIRVETRNAKGDASAALAETGTEFIVELRQN